MDPASLAIGAAVGGGAAAIALSMIMGGKKSQLEAAQTELESLKQSSEKEQSALKQKAEAAEKKATEANKKASSQADALKKAQTARDEAKRELEEHKKARQQAEGKVKAAEDLAAESSKKASQLESQLASAQSEASSANQIASRRNEEITKLRSALASAGADGGGLDAVELFADVGAELGKILETLLEHENQNAAVFADSNGIVIAGAGEKRLQDGLCATAQLLSNIGKQFEGMVPFTTVQSFDLRDSESSVLSGRAFSISGEPVALATYGKHVPNSRMLDGALATLKSALE